jgi:AcrR family transcriptional regulator
MTDVDSSRDRILTAAREAFAAVGFAGARVDGIARAAGCNKQLIYHYFGDKAGLYEAVVRDVLKAPPPMGALTREGLAEQLARLPVEELPRRREWLRMMTWEALTGGPEAVVAEDLRREHLCTAVAQVEAAQAADAIDPGIRPRFLLLALMSLCMFPYILPQLARMLTGLSPDDAEFRKQHAAMLREVARRLAPPTKPG